MVAMPAWWLGDGGAGGGVISEGDGGDKGDSGGDGRGVRVGDRGHYFLIILILAERGRIGGFLHFQGFCAMR